MTEVQWIRLTAAEITEQARADAVVVLPVGSIEQHGPHLPTMVDMRLAEEVSLRAARAAVATGTPCLVLPTLWAGIAEHHIPFGGTIALDYTTFAGFIRQVARSISAAGFQRLFIVNGHGGNTYPLQIAIKDITHETGVRLGASSYWLLAKQAFRDTLEDQVSVMHACEAETSMMLLIEGELVRRDQLAHAHGGRQVTHTPGEGTPVMRFTSYAERSNTGVRGDARRATAEKGAKLFDAVVAAVAQVIADARHWPAPDPVWRSGRALDPRSPI